MSRVYESLKAKVQGTLQRGKVKSPPLPEANSDNPLSLNVEMDELERIVTHRVGRLKAAVTQHQAVFAHEARQAEQLVEGLRVKIGALEDKLRETDETVRKKDLSHQKMEENLTAKIDDLQNDVKNKTEALENRGKEIKDFKSTLDGQVKQLADVELALQKAKVEAANHAKRADDLAASSQAKITSLESELRDAQGLARQKDSMIKGLEQNLAVKIQEFENELRNKQELLAGRDAQINNIRSQLNFLTKGIGEMSSFFRQAEALAAIEGQNVSPAVLKQPVNGEEDKPVTVQSNVPRVTPIVPDARRQIVSPGIIECITAELAEVAGVMRPFALIIVRDHMAALGESTENFPKARLPELLESLAKEISDENLKIDFRKRLMQNAQIVESGVLS